MMILDIQLKTTQQRDYQTADACFRYTFEDRFRDSQRFWLCNIS
jgi:hypothetical protein